MNKWGLYYQITEHCVHVSAQYGATPVIYLRDLNSKLYFKTTQLNGDILPLP